MFEAKLRPCFKSMNEGTNPLPPNTTTPYILPPVLCFHLFGTNNFAFSIKVILFLINNVLYLT